MEKRLGGFYMKFQVSMLALAMALGIAMAQDMPPAKTDMKDKKMAPKAEISSPAEMKTTTFRGTLIDMSCASKPADDTHTANRSAGDSGSSCRATASSTDLGMTLKDGRTVRFDLVGNQRAQDAIKSDKGWNKTIAAGKPVRATVSGVLNGDKLIVSSIH
jgi:hypothetical protein